LGRPTLRPGNLTRRAVVGALVALSAAGLVAACAPPAPPAPTTTTTTTTLPPGGGTPATVTVGYLHACSLRPNATVRCWGDNTYGQLGDGTTTRRLTPVTVPGLSDVVEVTAGGFHTCARRTDGTVTCWGSNLSGELGAGLLSTEETSPQDVFNLSDAVSVDAGGAHTCAVRAAGNVVCWGDGLSGQLGTGSLSSATTPRSVAGLSGVAQVASGDGHTCARRTVGTLACWGDNTNGQLGRGDLVPSPIAVNVPGVTDATSIVSGSAFSCALRAGGTGSCWGENLYGQIGNAVVLPPPPQEGDPPPPPLREQLPQSVAGLSGAVSISAGSDHACAVLGDGTALCWGNNQSNQLGDGVTVDPETTSIPVAVAGLTGAVRISAGETSTCAVRANATAACWGNNAFGQLGTNNTNTAPAPVAVVGL
jgi:alpha-tubulin suppressor-like RCC1 family protein